MHLRRARIRVLMLLTMLAPLVAMASTAREARQPVLPRASEVHPGQSVELRQIPFETFSYIDGRLTATWDSSRYRISEAFVAADMQLVEPYSPGRVASLRLDGRQYDVVGWMTDLSTGDVTRFISPIQLPVPAGEHDLLDDADPLSCTLTESVDCPDGSTASATCTGDTGGCHSCSLGPKACCSATTRRTEIMRSGREVQVVTTTYDSQTCARRPPLPRPGGPDVPNGTLP